MSIEIASIAMQCNVHYGHDCHDIEQKTQNTKQTNNNKTANHDDYCAVCILKPMQMHFQVIQSI